LYFLRCPNSLTAASWEKFIICRFDFAVNNIRKCTQFLDSCFIHFVHTASSYVTDNTVHTVFNVRYGLNIHKGKGTVHLRTGHEGPEGEEK
jgi:hypothetical protein